MSTESQIISQGEIPISEHRHETHEVLQEAHLVLLVGL